MMTRHAWIALLLIVGLGSPSTASEEPATDPHGDPDTSLSRPGVAESGAYRLGPEDVIEVFVWKEPELSTTVTVRPDGRIAIPLAGEVTAAGQTPKELEQVMRSRLAEYLDVPVVTVTVKEINSPKVSVLGEVRRPGRHVISQSTTVLDAIAMSGGLTEFANPGKVTVLRKTGSGVRRIPVDLKDWLRGRTAGKPLDLEPGDTVHVD